MTTPPFNHRWEKRLHEELRKLPDLEAPDTLVPNVMAAIRAQEDARSTAWWRRPATSWPSAMRIGMGGTALALFMLLVFAGHLLAPSIADSTESNFIAHTVAKFGELWTGLVIVIRALAGLFRQTVSPLLLAVIAGISLSYIALLGIGGALWRAVLHQSPR